MSLETLVVSFGSSLILSLSKDERLAQDRPIDSMSLVGGSSFDRLGTSGVQQRHAQETGSSAGAAALR